MLRRVALLSALLFSLSTGSAWAASTTITMTNNVFTPTAVTVAVGNSMVWKNASSRKHNETPIVNWSFGGATVKASKSSAPITATQAGAFAYFCSLHPKMKGTVNVALTVDQTAGTTATYFTF